MLVVYAVLGSAALGSKNGTTLLYMYFLFVSVVVTVDNRPIRLQLCDTAGQVSFFYQSSDLYFLPSLHCSERDHK